MTEVKQPIYSDAGEASYRPVTHEVVHRRFLALLARDRDTGLAIAWKEALLEPPNPLKPTKRPPFKLPMLYALWIAGLGVAGFLWFSFAH